MLNAKRLRMERGLTLTDVFTATGLLPATVSRVENGLRKKTDYSLALKLATLYGVTIDQLLKEVEPTEVKA